MQHIPCRATPLSLANCTNVIWLGTPLLVWDIFQMLLGCSCWSLVSSLVSDTYFVVSTYVFLLWALLACGFSDPIFTHIHLHTCTHPTSHIYMYTRTYTAARPHLALSRRVPSYHWAAAGMSVPLCDLPRTLTAHVHSLHTYTLNAHTQQGFINSIIYGVALHHVVPKEKRAEEKPKESCKFHRNFVELFCTCKWCH